MSLNFEHSDILLDTLLHSREQLKSERADPLPHSVSPRRRRTKSTAFEEPTVLKGFLGDWRSRSYGQDVAKLPETLIRKQETFTSIPEVEESWQGSECLPDISVVASRLWNSASQLCVTEGSQHGQETAY